MSTDRILLDDEAMRRFIIDGYMVLKPDFPDGFHQRVYDKIETVIEQGGNPGNNLLPRVPELQQVFDHPEVDGALASILGPDYYLHLHRHVHNSPPGHKAQNMHKDSLGNSRFAVDQKRRHHHTRWTMVFYYPQDTSEELGPTAVVPRSQYLNESWPEGGQQIPLCGEAGTIVIVHYDLLHGATPNRGDRTRHMVKFLFTRMSEPEKASWDHGDPHWQPAGDAQDGIWRHLWDWHRGVGDNQSPDADVGLEELARQLRHESEVVALNAAYQLGLRGTEAVPLLLEALQEEEEIVARHAGYAFSRIGPAAVAPLVAAARQGSEQNRARALDALGDMGPAAAEAVAGLLACLQDESAEVRSRAAESLGTVGQGRGDLGGPLGALVRGDQSDLVRRNAALSLARLGPTVPDAVEALVDGMADESHYVRGFSVHALDRIGTPQARTAVLQRLQTMRWD